MIHRAFEPSLAALKAWRDETAGALAALRRWAIVNALTDDQSAMRLASTSSNPFWAMMDCISPMTASR